MSLQVHLPQRKIDGQLRLVVADLTGRWGQRLKRLGFTPMRIRDHYMIKAATVRYDDQVHYDLVKLLTEASGTAPRDLRHQIVLQQNDFAAAMTKEAKERQRYGARRRHA